MSNTDISRRDSLKNLAALGVAGAAVAVGVSAMTAGPADAAQPLMHNALNDLQAARNALARALADKGGHRVRALALVEQAIAEVKAGIVAGAM
jgi:hypothetical protein